MGRKNRKRKASVNTDDVELTLSDLEEDRSDAQVTVDKISEDRRRFQQDQHIVLVSSEQDRLDVPPSVSDVPSEYLIPEFTDLDVDALQEDRKSLQSEPTRKERYVSSVRLYFLFLALLVGPTENFYRIYL